MTLPVVKTGDEANVLLWFVLAVIACGVLAGTTIKAAGRGSCGSSS